MYAGSYITEVDGKQHLRQGSSRKYRATNMPRGSEDGGAGTPHVTTAPRTTDFQVRLGVRVVVRVVVVVVVVAVLVLVFFCSSSQRSSWSQVTGQAPITLEWNIVRERGSWCRSCVSHIYCLLHEHGWASPVCFLVVSSVVVRVRLAVRGVSMRVHTCISTINTRYFVLNTRYQLQQQ